MGNDINLLILKVLVAALVGGIIGLEREKSKQISAEKSTLAVGGIRTDILIGIYGAVAAYLNQTYNGTFLICFLSILLFLGIPYFFSTFFQKSLNFKTSLSSLIVFLLGSLTMQGDMRLAVAIAVIVTMVISLRYAFHKAVFILEYNEIIDGIKFIFIAFIILPFLPNTGFDTAVWNFLGITDPVFLSKIATDILNPYKIWLLVVIISGINFLGYMLVKLFGQNKAYGITGFIGGFYSSTVTSLALCQESKKYPELKLPFLAGISLACASSFLKMFIVIKTLNDALFQRLFLSMILMCGYLLITGLILHLRANQSKTVQPTGNALENKLRNFMYMPDLSARSPLNLGSALKLALFVLATIIVASLILAFSTVALYYIVAGAMAFFAIDDPIIISTSEIAGKTLDLSIAKNIILTAIFLNLTQKVASVYFFGNKKLLKSTGLIFFGLLLVTGFSFIYL